jgi:hypothetical protein
MLSAFTAVLLTFAAGTAAAGGSGAVAAEISATLEGRGSVLAAQRTLSETLGWSTRSDAGVVAAGQRVRVRDLDQTALQREFERHVPVLHYVDVQGEGPEPLRVWAPIPEDAGEIEVHRRLEEGVFLRDAAPVTRVGGHARFEVTWPGRFVVRESDSHGVLDTKGFFEPGPLASLDPGIRNHWNLIPIAPEIIRGPVPVVLIHGAETNRWGDFRHWAQFSQDAAEFRRQFQLWDFNHELTGVNAAVGYDPTCPYFEDSIVATLDRFMTAAMQLGVESNGATWYFPSSPYAIMGHSHGALKARAFLVNFPEQAARCFAVMSISGDNTGSPWATPDWLRHTVSRLALTPARLLDRMLAAAYAGYYGLDIQSNLDAGWANLDARGGAGLPYLQYRTWTPEAGRTMRWLSPRDSLLTGARDLPEFLEDDDFDPQEPLPNLCGGIDLITPEERGGMYLDRHFIYANYIEVGEGWREILFQSGMGTRSTTGNIVENAGLRVANLLFAIVQSKNASWPNGTYQLGDGFVPLQSQVVLDGRETAPVFETESVFGWQHPARPLRPNMEVIRAHTLADPDRIRILPGWSHLDTITGRYNMQTGHSALFTMLAEDLLSALP